MAGNDRGRARAPLWRLVGRARAALGRRGSHRRQHAALALALIALAAPIAAQELAEEVKAGLFDALGNVSELPETPTAAEDRVAFAKSVKALEAYFAGGKLGLDEDQDVAKALDDELVRRARAYGLSAFEQEGLVLHHAELLVVSGKGALALERLGSLVPTDAARIFEFRLLAAQLEKSAARQEELLLAAESSLTDIKNELARIELESMWCCVAAQQAVSLGLPDRAAAPLARGLECARAFLKAGGTRLRLEDVLLKKIAVHHALIEHERVLELLRRPNPDLPPEGSAAALPFVVREGLSRASLETLGRTPADQGQRDPIALLEGALADGRLTLEDRQLASATLVQVWLDRSDLTRATEALARLPDLPRSALRLNDRVAFELELALRKGERTEFARLREAARAEWRGFLEKHVEKAAKDPELGLLHFDDVARLFRGLARLEVALEGPERGGEAALAELFEGQTITPMAQALKAACPSVAEARKLLVEGELALLHVPVREEGLIFVLTTERVELVPLAMLPDIVWTRRDFSLALDRALASENGPEWDEVERLAAALARIALPDELLARAARATRLSILAPENLGYVPFELLPGPDGRPLGLTLEVRYLPSMPVGNALAARRAARPARATPAAGHEVALLCAERPAPVGSTSFEPLPAGVREFETLLAPYAEARRALRVGDDADRAGLTELLATPAPVLQVVCHGHLDRSRVRPAQLVLAGANGLVSAEELEHHAFPPLVALASCGTWDGPRRRGDDGRAHLPSAFLLGGADTVIAAQRPLLFRPALAFFGAFHRSLRAGATPARALRDARAHVAETSTSRRERALACLIHAIGLADAPIY